jgi:hypothetical protein
MSVLCATGWTPIASVEAGDEVTAVDVATGATHTRRVLEQIRKPHARIWDVRLHGRDAAIETTAFHRFRTASGWKAARRLRPEGEILCEDGTRAVVENVNKTNRTEAVYNCASKASSHTSSRAASWTASTCSGR